jgi:hypothetical protein
MQSICAPYRRFHIFYVMKGFHIISINDSYFLLHPLEHGASVGRTPWVVDQLVIRSLPTQDNTNTEETLTDIHA